MQFLLIKSTKVLAYLSCVCLVLLMLVTFVDVIGRYFFNRPVTFAVELIELLMGLVVFFGLAYTTIKKAHITVDLLLDAVPRVVKSALSIFAALVSAVVIIIMAWRLTLRAVGFASDGLSTSVLFMPIAPFVFLMCAGAFLAAVVAVVQLVSPDYFKSASADDLTRES